VKKIPFGGAFAVHGLEIAIRIRNKGTEKIGVKNFRVKSFRATNPIEF